MLPRILSKKAPHWLLRVGLCLDAWAHLRHGLSHCESCLDVWNSVAAECDLCANSNCIAKTRRIEEIIPEWAFPHVLFSVTLFRFNSFFTRMENRIGVQ